MIMKSNLGKMLRRMAPQQGAGMTVQPQQPQLGGGLMSLLNQPNPPGGVTPSNMLANLGQMLSGQRPTRPTNTGNGMLVMPAIPQPYQQGPMAQPHIYNPVNTTTERDLRGPRGMGGMRNMFGVNPNDLAAMGGILPKLAEQFRNAEAMPSNWVSAPRQLTPEEQIAITSRPVAPMQPGMPSVDPNVPYRPTGPDAFYGNEPKAVMTPPTFDRNAALQAFNARAAEANKMFTSGLFGTGGVSPDEFRSYQTKLRDLQLDTGSTPQQHEAALNEAMAYMNRVAPRPVELPRAIPQGMGQVSGVGNAAPAFDPNRALQELNAQLGRIHKGGGQLDMNFVRDQQARLRDLQVNRDATPEQHDAAYRNAMAELRARYPDAFAG